MQSLHILQLSELLLVIIYSGLLLYELKGFKPVLSQPQTQLLIGFLLSLTLTHICRLVGLYLGNIVIRTYLSALFGLTAAILFIEWGALMIQMSKDKKIPLYGSLVVLFSLFVVGRTIENQILEIFGLVSSIFVVVLMMGLIFRYVFKSSPYAASRQKLFMLSISFVIYCVFEGFYINYLRIEDFTNASIALFFIVIMRFAFNISIFLPDRVQNLLSHIIK